MFRRHSVRISTALQILLLFAVASCRTAQPSVSDMESAELQQKRRLLSTIKEGMTEQQVVEILGNADEVRPVMPIPWCDRREEEGVKLRPEGKRWAYGIQAEKAFAAVGVVVFDEDGEVLGTYRPDNSYCDCEIPYGEDPVRTESGMCCRLDSVRPISSEFIEVSAVLLNGGSEAFHLKDMIADVESCFVVEVYDSHKTLLYRINRIFFTSPAYSHQSEIPSLTIPAGEKYEVSFNADIDVATFGPLLPGRYFIRVAFPFEEKRYYPSNLVGLDLP
jgi:hypothetical protein